MKTKNELLRHQLKSIKIVKLLFLSFFAYWTLDNIKFLILLNELLSLTVKFNNFSIATIIYAMQI
jgi:hypothetical protein